MSRFTLQRPLDEDARVTLAELQTAARALDIQTCLIGAQARIIWLEHIYGLPSRRPTEDMDFAVQIDHWDQFEDLGARLIQDHGWRKDSKQAQRFISATNRIVDLVPCGGIVEDHAILWPPDRTHRMDVRGFELAMGEAVEIPIDDADSILIAPMPVLALLKIVSWWDRSSGNSKDAEDLITLLRKFADSEGVALFDVEANFDLYELEDDHELRGAHLLGRIVAGIAAEDTLDLARQILADGISEAGDQRLVIQGAPAMAFDTETREDRALALLQALQRGLAE